MPTDITTKLSEDICNVRMIHLDRVKKAREEAIAPADLNRLSLIFKALGDPTRLGIVTALVKNEMCVCDIAATLTLSESAVSHQLRRLRELSLVKNRREGPVLYYSLDDRHITDLLQVGLDHIRE
ncbi:MAG: winged helix-turn-helix transcriptional regulator [Proteobacteria bacterium]|nr:winged helix-turn-helix transcriptional regulator [Pseudomonadota bacterium]